MRVIGISLLVALSFAGCDNSRDQQNKDTTAVSQADTTEINGETETAASVPATSSVLTPEELPVQNEEVTSAGIPQEGLATDAAISSPTASPGLVGETVAYPASEFPQEMAATVQLHELLKGIPPGAGSLEDNQVLQIKDYVKSMEQILGSSDNFTKEQRVEIESLTGKMDYQADEVREGKDPAQFNTKLESLKNAATEIQVLLAQ